MFFFFSSYFTLCNTILIKMFSVQSASSSSSSSAAAAAASFEIERKKKKEKQYYVIPMVILDSIQYYANGGGLFGKLNYTDTTLLSSLFVGDIHTDNNGAIDSYLGIFRRLFDDLNDEVIYDDDDEGIELLDNIRDIVVALESRKKAIKEITFDVLQKHAFETVNCGNF